MESDIILLGDRYGLVSKFVSWWVHMCVSPLRFQHWWFLFSISRCCVTLSSHLVDRLLVDYNIISNTAFDRTFIMIIIIILSYISLFLFCICWFLFMRRCCVVDWKTRSSFSYFRFSPEVKGGNNKWIVHKANRIDVIHTAQMNSTMCIGHPKLQNNRQFFFVTDNSNRFTNKRAH